MEKQEQKIRVSLDNYWWKRKILTEKFNIEHEKHLFFLKMLDGCELYENKEHYPEWIFWKKNDEVLFEQNDKLKVFYIKYSRIWRVFEVKYDMDYSSIQDFTQNRLLTPMKLEGYTTNEG